MGEIIVTVPAELFLRVERILRFNQETGLLNKLLALVPSGWLVPAVKVPWKLLDDVCFVLGLLQHYGTRKELATLMDQALADPTSPTPVAADPVAARAALIDAWRELLKRASAQGEVKAAGFISDQILKEMGL